VVDRGGTEDFIHLLISRQKSTDCRRGGSEGVPVGGTEEPGKNEREPGGGAAEGGGADLTKKSRKSNKNNPLKSGVWGKGLYHSKGGEREGEKGKTGGLKKGLGGEGSLPDEAG